MFQWRQITGTGLFAVLLLSVTSCAPLPPPQVAWENDQSVVGPMRPEPQGLLVVYSESYAGEEGELPTTYRRPVLLYDSAGQFLGKFNAHSVPDDPVQIWRSPGRYIVVSEVNKKLRQVEVEIDDRQTTIVSESVLVQAPPALSS